MSEGIARRKLLILTTKAQIGGMERVACGLAREFTERGWLVRAVFPLRPNNDAFLKWCREQGVEAEASPALCDAGEPHSLANMRKLHELVRAWRPDVINLHYGDNTISLKDVAAVRASTLSPCVVSVHHPSPWDTTNKRKKLLTRCAAALAHQVTTFSQATKRVLLEAGVSATKLHVIHCGVRPPTNLPLRAEARARLGFPPDAFIIGCMGRQEAYKGVDHLTDAVARMPDPDGRLLLLVAGDGPDRNRLEAHATATLGARARFLGRVPDIDDFLACCDVFSLPSQLEGFGLVYVEAAFHGLPSVAARVGGVPDAITDGVTGLLVPVGDVSAIADALQRLRSDGALRVKLGEAARARANDELTEAHMTAGFERVFRAQGA